ncbi:MAG: ACP S-malonyltransferase [bacterium]
MNKIALLFPGQGAQYVGMGKELCENFTIADQVWQAANDILGFNLQKICFEGDLEQLTHTENAQPALLTTSYAYYQVLLCEHEITPAFFAGHSLGEFTALACAGVLSFKDALKLVRKRGQLMKKASESNAGTMAAVLGMDIEMLEEECTKVSREDSLVVISNHNSPEQAVISGHEKAISTMSEIVVQKGARLKKLEVSAAFHSPLMREVAGEFKDELRHYQYKTPNYPIISNVTGEPLIDSTLFIDELAQQLMKSVQWASTMRYLKEQGVTIFIDSGPRKIVKNLAIKNIPQVAAYSLDDENDRNNLREILPLKNHKTAPNLVSKCLAIAVCTQNRNWDNDEYERGVVKPYQQIQNLQNQIEESGEEPDKGQMLHALTMLRSIFETKKTPLKEQIERFHQIFDQTGKGFLFHDFEMPQEQNS